jgi:hypothetical protein
MAELLILKCGHMKTEYSMWKTLLAQDRTFTNFCNWWKEKYTIWKTTHQAASSFGYGGVATHEVDEEIDTMNAATNAANAATFQQLSETNNALAQQLQALQLANSQLQQQMAASMQNVPKNNISDHHSVCIRFSTADSDVKNKIQT